MPLLMVSGTVIFEPSGSTQALLDGSLVSAHHACAAVVYVLGLSRVIIIVSLV